MLVVSSYRSRIVVESQCDIGLRYDYDPTTTHRARLLPFDAIRHEQKKQESRAVAREPRDDAAVVFGLKFADNASKK